MFATAPVLLSMVELLRSCLGDLLDFLRRFPKLFLAEVKYILAGIEPDPLVQDDHPLPNVTSCQDNCPPPDITSCQVSHPSSNVASCQGTQTTANARSARGHSLLPEPYSAAGSGLGQDTSSRASCATSTNNVCDEV